MGVAHVTVAVNAREHFTFAFAWKHLVHHIRMAMKTRALRHPPIARFDLNWLMEVFQSERQRMKKTVVCLGTPLANKIVWQVTVIANGHMLMAGILPRVEVILHNMAVGTCLGVVAQVTSPLPIAEGKHAYTRQRTQH